MINIEKKTDELMGLLQQKEQELNDVTHAMEQALMQADDAITTLDEQLGQARADLQEERDRADRADKIPRSIPTDHNGSELPVVPVQISGNSGNKEANTSNNNTVTDLDERMAAMAGKLQNHGVMR